MIIIIRALSPNKKRPKRKKKKGQRKIKEKKKRIKKEKNEIKRGNVTILFHTCASKQHHVLHIESLLCCHFHILVGIFIVELGLYIPTMGFLKMLQVFVIKQVGCTPTQFLLLSFHTFIALVHPLHGNPYSSY